MFLRAQSSLKDLKLPTSLENAVRANLDSLFTQEPAVKLLVELTTTLGGTFTMDFMAMMWQQADGAEDDLQKALMFALKKKLLSSLSSRGFTSGARRKSSIGEGLTFAFAHLKTQDVMSESMLKARKQELHELAISVLVNQDENVPPEVLAFHAEESGDLELAAKEWRRAAAIAKQSLSPLLNVAMCENCYESCVELQNQNGGELSDNMIVLKLLSATDAAHSSSAFNAVEAVEKWNKRAIADAKMVGEDAPRELIEVLAKTIVTECTAPWFGSRAMGCDAVDGRDFETILAVTAVAQRFYEFVVHKHKDFAKFGASKFESVYSIQARIQIVSDLTLLGPCLKTWHNGSLEKVILERDLRWCDGRPLADSHGTLQLVPMKDVVEATLAYDVDKHLEADLAMFGMLSPVDKNPALIVMLSGDIDGANKVVDHGFSIRAELVEKDLPRGSELFTFFMIQPFGAVLLKRAQDWKDTFQSNNWCLHADGNFPESQSSQTDLRANNAQFPPNFACINLTR